MAKTNTEPDNSFPDPIKDIISKRAGYICSFPNCNSLLIGPGVENNEVVMTGECAHIFSAAAKGPRSSGTLTPAELKSISNGILLCRKHHKIIDRKHKSNKYTSDILTQMKDLHEFNISARIGENNYPLQWIKNFEIETCPIFSRSLSVNLGKLTFIKGTNNTGKSIFCELLATSLTTTSTSRVTRLKGKTECNLVFDNPVMSKIGLEIEGSDIHYLLRKEKKAFIPYRYNLIFLSNDLEYHRDDLKAIAHCIGFTREYIISICRHLTISSKLFAEEIRVEFFGKRNRTELQVKIKGCYVDFKSLSGGEQALAILDVILSYAKDLSAFQPVILLIDWKKFHHLDSGNVQKVVSFLRSTQISFQSIVVSPHSYSELDWQGWTIAQFNNEVPDTVVDQSTV